MRSLCLKSCFTVAGIAAVYFTAAQVAAVRFIVKIPQTDTQDNRNVYLAGSFNGWSSHDSLYIMNKDEANTYSLLVPLFDGKSYTYKYTRGNWNTVETKMNDSDISNRRLFSRNALVVYDTVLKWKAPPPQASKTPSPQMQRLMTMRDSTKVQLQSTLTKLLVVLKEYNEVMLAPKPNERKHKKLNKKTIGIISELYKTVEAKVWEAGTSLSPEQKQKILAAIKDPNASKDLLTTLGKAYGDALK